MAQDNTYNGWTNWETWQVNLWFGNYFSSCVEDGEEVTEDTIRDIVEEEVNGDDVEGIVGDILNGFIGNVNWYELASHYVEEEETEE